MRKDDTFSTTMLGYALEKLAEEANDDGSRCWWSLLMFRGGNAWILPHINVL